MKKLKKGIMLFIGLVFMILMLPFTASAATADSVYTGDGRIYLALGFFVIAIVIVVLMIALKNKTKK